MENVKEYVLFIYNFKGKPHLKSVYTLKSLPYESVFTLLSAINIILSRIVVQIEFLYFEEGELKNVSREAKIKPITVWEYKKDIKSYIGFGEMSVGVGEPFKLIVFVREK